MIKKAFTLAEVLIVIGIIGVVAALTLPNLNHATGDKETVTRLQKAYSILNEANDRAVAIYGPISTWKNTMKTGDSFYERFVYMNRLAEFLKISKYCDETSVARANGIYVSCDSLQQGGLNTDGMIYQLSDGLTYSVVSGEFEPSYDYGLNKDICFDEMMVDINGPNKGKNIEGEDIFIFMVSDTQGILPYYHNNIEDAIYCKEDTWYCTAWVLEYGNLDYLKADGSGQCNNSNIILDGTTNTSCH